MPLLSDSLFCPSCGNLLDLPGTTNDTISCNLCNHSVRCEAFEKVEVVTRSRPDAFIGAKLGAGSAGDDDDEEQFMTGAIIDERCSKCGHDKMRFFTMQLRSADEGQTVFYTCVKCQYTYSLNS